MPDDDEQPDINLAHLEAMGQIFAKHGVTDLLGVHLIHGHSQISEDKIMLGTSFYTGKSGRWTKPTSISGVDLHNIHGHIFVLKDEQHFVAYEYREGAKDLSGAKIEFFADFVGYLLKHKLENLLGLQVLDGHDSMVEFVLDNGGTVMLKEKDAKFSRAYRTTGWRFSSDGTISHSGDTHAGTVRGTHQVFTGSKPLTTIKGLHELLVTEDLINIHDV